MGNKDKFAVMLAKNKKITDYMKYILTQSEVHFKFYPRMGKTTIYQVLKKCRGRCHIVIYDCYSLRHFSWWEIDAKDAIWCLRGIRTTQRRTTVQVVIHSADWNILGHWTLSQHTVFEIAAALPAANIRSSMPE